MTRAIAIVPAAGLGRRMGSRSKAFLEVAGKPVLAHTLDALLAEPRIERILVPLSAEMVAAPPEWLRAMDKRVKTLEGGAERMESVRRALDAVSDSVDVVLVHDAARPLVSRALISDAIDAAAEGRSVTAAVPLSDTVHEVAEDGRIIGTPDRSRLWRAQTPQAFPLAVLRAAHLSAEKAGVTATDDAALVARFVGPVYVLEGDATNMKLTVPADVIIAEALLRGS